MDGGAWWATVHGVTKSRTRLNDFTSWGLAVVFSPPLGEFPSVYVCVCVCVCVCLVGVGGVLSVPFCDSEVDPWIHSKIS